MVIRLVREFHLGAKAVSKDVFLTSDPRYRDKPPHVLSREISQLHKYILQELAIWNMCGVSVSNARSEWHAL